MVILRAPPFARWRNQEESAGPGNHTYATFQDVVSIGFLMLAAGNIAQTCRVRPLQHKRNSHEGEGSNCILRQNQWAVFPAFLWHRCHTPKALALNKQFLEPVQSGQLFVMHLTRNSPNHLSQTLPSLTFCVTGTACKAVGKTKATAPSGSVQI